ncbi:MAG: OmpA family protein [Bacteroidetes bacterium]|nr:OmpA family protein [Bacteroidota bacterium]MDA0903052.1 OmpA family protein [Bacteroidota bacterium]MDA1241738.1 OmpA family protein [Bacteroidota bacterium]
MEAQVNPIKGSAKKAYSRAVEAYRNRDVYGASGYLNRAVEISPSYAKAWFLKAQVELELGQTQASEHALKRGLAIDDSIYPVGWVDLAQLQWESGQYEQASASLSSLPPSVDMSPEGLDRKRWVEAGVAFSLKHVGVHEQELPELVPGDLNSDAREYYGAFDLTGERFVFTRSDIAMDSPDRNVFGVAGGEDFWEAQLDAKGSWVNARPLRGVNTPLNEGAPTWSGDGKTMIFTACELPREGYGDRRGKGSCDLFESTWEEKRRVWSLGQNLGAPNSSGWESQPTLSADGNTLVFSKSERGLNKQSDLCICERSPAGGWSEPSLLPGLVNTPRMEESSFLHPDGQTLYFSSNGHPGFGGLDVFVSRRQLDGSWGQPVNLGWGINSPQDDNSLVVTPQGDRAFFASNREGSGLDFWQAFLPESARAIEVASLQGVVQDAITGLPLVANVRLMNASTGLKVGEVMSKQDGSFMMPLPARGEYSFEVRLEGYVFGIQSYSQGVIDKEAQSLHVRIDLDPIVSGTQFVLDAIQFESGSAFLLPIYQAGCEQLNMWLEQNPSIHITLVGHTDNVGSQASNLQLSRDRASEVRKFLIDRGVDASRIDVDGKGSSDPLADNATEEGRAVNRRVQVVVQ